MENLNRFEVIVMKSLKCASAEVRKKSIKYLISVILETYLYFPYKLFQGIPQISEMK